MLLAYMFCSDLCADSVRPQVFQYKRTWLEQCMSAFGMPGKDLCALVRPCWIRMQIHARLAYVNLAKCTACTQYPLQKNRTQLAKSLHAVRTEGQITGGGLANPRVGTLNPLKNLSGCTAVANRDVN